MKLILSIFTNEQFSVKKKHCCMQANGDAEYNVHPAPENKSRLKVKKKKKSNNQPIYCKKKDIESNILIDTHIVHLHVILHLINLSTVPFIITSCKQASLYVLAHVNALLKKKY